MTVELIRPASADWPPRVGALTTTRAGPDAVDGPWNLADHVGDDPRTVAANRRALLRHTGVSTIQWLQQVHGSRCLAAGAATVDGVPEADAAWTQRRGLGLAILTADCIPAVLCDRRGSVVGVAHGGWRGLVAGVLEALVAGLPVPPGELIAWLGPAIGPDAYEVGDDVVAAVAALAGGGALVEACVRAGPRPGRQWLDLFALSEQLLRRAGVPVVLSERLCTYSDRRFFSHRRDGRTGRMVTLAWLD